MITPYAVIGLVVLILLLNLPALVVIVLNAKLLFDFFATL